MSTVATSQKSGDGYNTGNALLLKIFPSRFRAGRVVY
jgi:hypothetical protein